MGLDTSVNAPHACNNAISEWVWFTGITALLEGQGVCYDSDRGTAAESDAKRTNYVELPSTSNARFFAGVASQAYAAKSTGQMIKIFRPGSTCNILSNASTTVNTGILTCEVGGSLAGYFRYAGFEGEGSVVPLQTIDRSSTAGVCQARLMAGIPSGLVESVTAAAVGGATTFLVGGVSYVQAQTLSNDATLTLADGTVPGQRKAFYLVGAQTTNNLVITVTSGMQADGSTALATWTADAATDELILQWNGIGAAGVWTELAEVGGTKA